MFLNVIIPSYNAGKTIADTLLSVRDNVAESGLDADITVVDSSDPLSDDTRAVIENCGVESSKVYLNKQAYPGAARNRGIEATKGDILCFIDSDAYAGKDWLLSIHDYLEKNPDVAAVGGPVLNANPKEGFSRLAHWCEFSGYGPRAPEGERRLQPTVNVAIRRDAFLKFGPFLEDQFGNEDVLLFSRMKQAGAKLHFNRRQCVYHRNKTSFNAIRKHQYRLGECTGRARVMYDLPGSFLTRGCRSMLIPFVKTHFIGWRLLTQETPEFPLFFACWPRVFLAMIDFKRGFEAGVNSAREAKVE